MFHAGDTILLLPVTNDGDDANEYPGGADLSLTIY